MNRKQLILILIFLAVVGSAGLILLNRQRESWAVPETKMGEKVLPNFQPNDVESIRIKGASEVNLVHKDGLWRVPARYDYPANFHQISDVLIKLKELKIVEANTVEESDLARVNLLEPAKGAGSGTLVEFSDAQGKRIAAILVGKRQMHARDESSRSPILDDKADGCYIRLLSNPKEVLSISDPLSALQPDPQAWLSHDFIRVEKPKSISFISPDPANSWTITRESETSPWVLRDAKPDESLDGIKALAAANALVASRFNDVIPSNSTAETGLEKPRVVKLETFNHFAYTLKIGSKTPEGYYYLTVAVATDLPQGASEEAKKLQEKLKQEQMLAPWIYEVGTWILDPLLRDRAQMLQGAEDSASHPEKKPAAAGSSPGWTPSVIQ
jgi:hypothetical protein